MAAQPSEVSPQSTGHAALPDYIALDPGEDPPAHTSVAENSTDVEARRKLEEAPLSSTSVAGFPGEDAESVMSSASRLLDAAPGEAQSEEEFIKKWSLRLAAANRKVEEAKAEKELAERMLAMVGGRDLLGSSSQGLHSRPFSMPVQGQESNKPSTATQRRNSERHRFWLF